MRAVIVSAGILVEDGRVLLTQRKAGGHLAGMSEFPGGKVEEGEDPRRALARELGEELGIDVEVGEIVDVTFHSYPEKSVLLLFFEARRKPGSPPPRALDVAAFEWAGEEGLIPERFPPADVGVLRKVKARLRTVI
jgi:8-oxo-dGTP diphosphatase